MNGRWRGGVHLRLGDGDLPPEPEPTGDAGWAKGAVLTLLMAVTARIANPYRNPPLLTQDTSTSVPESAASC